MQYKEKFCKISFVKSYMSLSNNNYLDKHEMYWLYLSIFCEDIL